MFSNLTLLTVLRFRVSTAENCSYHFRGENTEDYDLEPISIELNH